MTGIPPVQGHPFKKGITGRFLQRVNAGLIPKGTALVIENLDRLSRQGIRVTRQLIERLTDAGIDVHVVSISGLFKLHFRERSDRLHCLGRRSERALGYLCRIRKGRKCLGKQKAQSHQRSSDNVQRAPLAQS